MKRLTSLLAATVPALLLAVPAAGPAHAEPAQHAYLPESYAGSEHLTAEENSCGWAATFTETREGGFQLLLAPGGQAQDEVHIRGRVEGTVELVPDDPALPTYRGSYVERVNGVLTGVDEAGDDVMRVVHVRLRTPLTGTDGSRLVVTVTGHVTLNAAGEVVRAWYDESCA